MPSDKPKRAKVVPFPTPELPEESEDALALEFAAGRKNDLRYVAPWRAWMMWDGVTWRRDAANSVLNSIRTLTRTAADRIMSSDEQRARARAVSVASARWAQAVETLARTDPRLAASPDVWDGHPTLLGTPESTIDLLTGEARRADPAAHLTKLTSTAPAAAQACPVWLAFLDTVTGGDIELIAFLRRVAGYSLTGDTREHVLFFLHGPGRNGKSVFASTLAAILNDYAIHAPMDILVAPRGERHPTELAMLRGARLVVATETEVNRPWAAARVKQLTGGDRIRARHMRRDFFEFTPEFKLMVVGNHLPALGRMDPALSARIHVIPFSVTIPLDKRDKNLTTKLLKEASAILRWAIAGCLEWQRVGLDPPEVVLAATRDYVQEADLIVRWLGDCCARDKDAKAGSTELYNSWSRWTSSHGQPAGSQTAFAENLKLRGFEKGRLSGGAMAFHGLKLLRPPA